MTDIEALRARMREAAESGFDYLEVPAPDCLALDAEITRLRDDLDRVTREREEAREQVDDLSAELDDERHRSRGDWASQRANDHLTIEMYQWKARAESAEAALAKMTEEVARLRGALETIANRHIPDQPAHFGGDELEWAQRHVASLRRLAIEALTQEPTNA